MKTIYAVFSSAPTLAQIRVLEGLREETPDDRHLPRVDCPEGHGSPSPRPVWLGRASLDFVARTLSEANERIRRRKDENSPSMDDLVWGGDVEAFQNYERARSLTVSEFLHYVAVVRSGAPELTDMILNPGTLFGPLVDLRSKGGRIDGKQGFLFGNEKLLLLSQEAASELKALSTDAVFVEDARHTLVQVFVTAPELEHSRVHGWTFGVCGSCGLLTDYVPQGRLITRFAGTPELFYVKGGGLLHTWGRAAERLETVSGIELVPWGFLED